MTKIANGVYNVPKSDPVPDSAEPLQHITIALTAEDLALLDEVGQGNRSEGVRLALRTLRSQRADLKRIIAHMETDPTSVVSHDELQQRLSAKESDLHVVAT